MIGVCALYMAYVHVYDVSWKFTKFGQLKSHRVRMQALFGFL